jgi:hypothetical protein
MEAAQTSWRSLGELFVERGLISEADLERALAEQVATKRRLADILVRRGLVTGHDITSALMEQLGREAPPMQASAVAAPAPAPALAAIESAPAPDPVAVEPEPEPVAEVAPDPEPAIAAAPAPEVELSVSAHALIAEADSRRRGAEAELNAAREAHAQVLRGLEKVRAELDARDLSTESLTREVEQTQVRLRNREDELSSEVASWEDAKREAERCGGQLTELQTRYEEKAQERSEASASVAAWSARAKELDAETIALAGRVHAAAHALEELAARFPSNGADLNSISASSAGLYFVPNDEGYDLVEREGELPSIGAAMEFDGQDFVVTKIGRSPLPFDRRNCVFLAAV